MSTTVREDSAHRYTRGITTSLQGILTNVFGYHTFHGDQEAAINAALNGQDFLVLQPTGGGKLICY
ncbi:MAG: hypothetical protein P8K83_00455 [Woeseiaceae bacterium]|nr:hypothetical protein [Woeseiaceae bacterium]